MRAPMPTLRRSILSAALAVAGSVAAAAQSPPTPQAGAPWQPSDSIYKLAVDSTYKTDRPTIYLLDEGRIRFEADGRASRTFHLIVQVLKQSVVESMSERRITWMPDRQQMRVNWVKVLRPSGEVISEQPAQSQDSDVPAALSNPVYGNTRVRRMSLAGLAAGTLLDISFTVDDTAAYPPMDQFATWNVSTATTVRRSRLTIDVPESVKLALVEKNLSFKRSERVVNGRRIYQWATADVPYVAPELYAADSNGVDMRVHASLPRAWRDVGLWYDGLAKSRYTLGPSARAKITAAVAGARTRDDSIRALHKLAAADIRYVSVSLGIGGYQPRSPDTVAVTGFGDCKDKATFFVAAMRDWGLESHPVLINAGGGVESALPSARQFNHAIAAVETPGGYQFVDLTAANVPFGEIPPSVQGQFALVIRADGRVDEVRLPVTPVERTRRSVKITGELSPDGIFNGRYEETNTGDIAVLLRAAFANPMDSTRRANLTRSLASGVYPGAMGDSLRAFDGRDFSAPATVSLVVRGARAASKSGASMILNLNLGNFSGVLTTIDRLTSQGARKYPIDAEAVLGNSVRETEFRVTLPPGWKAQLPGNITASSVFGDVRVEYSQVGRDLIIRRGTTGKRGVYGPEKIADLIAWLKVVGQDDARFILLDTGGD
jgi:transglutaminase-like putative cysteine protease